MKHFAPKSISELITVLEEMNPQSKIIAGGTDLVIKMNLGQLNPDSLIYLGDIAELSKIKTENGKIEIGAAATMRQIADNSLIKENLAALADAACDVGSPQIRNSGTIGGNVGSASPAGDTIPVLFLYNAEVTIASKDGLYTKPMDQVVLGPSKTGLAYNEAIVKFTINLSESPSYKSAFVKLGYRKAVTVSRIGLAISGIINNKIITEPNIIVSSISATPLHLKKAEDFLDGKAIDDQSIETTAKFLSELIVEVTPEMFDRDYKAGAARGIVEDVLNKLI